MSGPRGAWPAARFDPGRPYRLAWRWGSVAGALTLVVLDRRGPLFRARLALVTNSAASRILVGRMLPEPPHVLEMRTVPGDGLPRPRFRLRAGDPSRRWLYQDAAYRIVLRDRAGGISGESEGDVAWLLSEASPPEARPEEPPVNGRERAIP